MLIYYELTEHYKWRQSLTKYEKTSLLKTIMVRPSENYGGLGLSSLSFADQAMIQFEQIMFS